jgi:hypothetical protein
LYGKHVLLWGRYWSPATDRYEKVGPHYRCSGGLEGGGLLEARSMVPLDLWNGGGVGAGVREYAYLSGPEEGEPRTTMSWGVYYSIIDANVCA